MIPLSEDKRACIDSLEFFLSDICNLRCACCAASSPFMRTANFPELSVFEESLAALSRVIRASQIKFVGGEPLLNSEACAFMAAARRSGMFGRVRLNTNGMLFAQASDQIWRLADVIEVSYYPNVSRPFGLNDLERLRAQGRLFGAEPEIITKREFSQATLDTLNPDKNAVRRIHAECTEAHPRGRNGPCHTLYGRRLYRCSRVHTIDRYLSEIGVLHAAFTEEDGLPVDDNLSHDRLVEYLKSSKPLKACGFCLGTSGRHVPHREWRDGELRRKRAGFDRTAFSPEMLQSDADGGPRKCGWFGRLNRCVRNWFSADS